MSEKPTTPPEETQPKEMSKEEFMTKFKGMETDMKEIKEFMNNILKAVDTKEEKPAGKGKENWLEEFFGSD